jgi:hypothetical protein
VQGDLERHREVRGVGQRVDDDRLDALVFARRGLDEDLVVDLQDQAGL